MEDLVFGVQVLVVAVLDRVAKAVHTPIEERPDCGFIEGRNSVRKNEVKVSWGVRRPRPRSNWSGHAPV